MHWFSLSKNQLFSYNTCYRMVFIVFLLKSSVILYILHQHYVYVCSIIIWISCYLWFRQSFQTIFGPPICRMRQEREGWQFPNHKSNIHVCAKRVIVNYSCPPYNHWIIYVVIPITQIWHAMLLRWIINTYIEPARYKSFRTSTTGVKQTWEIGRFSMETKRYVGKLNGESTRNILLNDDV